MLVIILAVLLILSVIKMSNDKIRTSNIKEDINEMMIPLEVSGSEKGPSDDWMVPPDGLENNEADQSVPSDESPTGSSESYDDTPNPDTGLDEESSPSDEWMIPPDL